MIDVKEDVFYKVMVGPDGTGSIKPNVHDMLMVMFANNNEEIFIERKRLTLLDILANAGGFASIIILFSRIFSQYYARVSLEEKLIRNLCKVDSSN